MTVIYASDEPTHPGFGLAKHKIGDKVRVVKVTLTETDHADTKHCLLYALGKVFKIQDISLWETSKSEDPWHIAYEIAVGKNDTLFLGDDEIVAAE